MNLSIAIDGPETYDASRNRKLFVCMQHQCGVYMTFQHILSLRVGVLENVGVFMLPGCHLLRATQMRTQTSIYGTSPLFGMKPSFSM